MHVFPPDGLSSLWMPARLGRMKAARKGGRHCNFTPNQAFNRALHLPVIKALQRKFAWRDKVP